MRLKPLFLLPFLFLILSCSPKERGQRDSSLETGPANLSGEGTALTLKKTGSDTQLNKENETKEPGGKSVLDSFSGPLQLQSINAASYHLPESLMIGTLADPFSYSLDERKAYSLFIQFWDIYRQGRLPSELLSKKVHPLFLEEMTESLETVSALLDFYPGSFQLSGSSASIKLVLLTESGYLKGTMYMVNENNKWVFNDWEIPFRDWPGETVPREKDLLQRRTVY